MVVQQTQVVHRISFEDIADEIRANKRLRKAVLRFVVHEFTKEMVAHLEIAQRKAKKR
jgi:hypothetical protein